MFQEQEKRIAAKKEPIDKSSDLEEWDKELYEILAQKWLAHISGFIYTYSDCTVDPTFYFK